MCSVLVLGKLRPRHKMSGGQGQPLGPGIQLEYMEEARACRDIEFR